MRCRADGECQTFYRYAVADHWEGQVYPSLEQAARGEGGYSVEAALEESLAWGLAFDDIHAVSMRHTDLVWAAELSWLLEVTDLEQEGTA